MNEEDTELRDLISQTLENNGVLSKIRAELRASVFLALEDHESKAVKRQENKELQEFLKTHNGLVILSLVKDFLQSFNLDKTLLVLEPELGASTDGLSREALKKEFKVPTDRKAPILSTVLEKALSTVQSQAGRTNSHNSSMPSGVPKDLNPAQIEDAKKKFRHYDKDNNNQIDKEELRQLFQDMFPAFNRNMIDRYVNDEFRAVDRDFSNSIDIDEFLGMYKRLFIQCRAVVTSDVEGILPANSPSHLARSGSDSSLSRLSSAKKIPKPTGGRTGGNNSEDDVSFDESSLNLSGSGKLNRSQTGHAFGGASSEGSTPRSPSATSGSKIPKFRGSSYSSDKTKSGVAKSSNATSLRELPPLGDSDSLKGSLIKPKPESSKAEHTKKVKEFSFDDLEDFDYQDDFDDSMKSASQNKTLSARSGQGDKSNAAGRDRSQSIEEEIEEALDDDDDLFNSHSALDDMTNDVTVDSDRSLGVDYVEDLLKK